MASSALALASAASKIQTIGQIRAAMGAVSRTLSQGYAVLDQVTSIAGVKDAARSLLDTVNKSAQALYNIYNDDPDLQDEEISTWHAHLAGEVVAQANDALKSVEDAAGQNLFDLAAILEDALTTVGTTAGHAVQSVSNSITAGATAFVWATWKTLALVGVGVVLYLNRDKVISFFKGKATL